MAIKKKELKIKCPDCKAEIPIFYSIGREEKKEEGPFALEKYLKIMKDDKNIHIQLIGYYIELRKLQPRNVYQTREIIKRHLRAARDLSRAYSPEEIMGQMAKMDRLYEKNVRWTLDTVLKELTK